MMLQLQILSILLTSSTILPALRKINVGCTVKAYDITFDEEIEFKLVGSTEANSLEGKISNESPVGHALIGKTIGDVVEVETQAGVMQYKVLDITRTV